jgi:hypothetical protein
VNILIRERCWSCIHRKNKAQPEKLRFSRG